tara:strand:+ start:593 stop:910 length:318 start_codon:yes stop_codon:yes gene_type:complete
MASGYTVIKVDTAIYKDGNAIFGCDMSGLPEDFHALQWDGSDGHIEYVDALKSNLLVSSKSQIESALSVSLPTLIERRDTRIAEIVVEKAVVAEAAAAERAAENE